MTDHTSGGLRTALSFQSVVEWSQSTAVIKACQTSSSCEAFTNICNLPNLLNHVLRPLGFWLNKID